MIFLDGSYFSREFFSTNSSSIILRSETSSLGFKVAIFFQYLIVFYFLWNRNKNINISPEVCKKSQKTHKQKAEFCLEKCLMSLLIPNFIFQLFLILYQFLDWQWWFEQQQYIHLFLFEEFEDPNSEEWIST